MSAIYKSTAVLGTVTSLILAEPPAIHAVEGCRIKEPVSNSWAELAEPRVEGEIVSSAEVVTFNRAETKTRWTGYDETQFKKLLTKKLDAGLSDFESKQFKALRDRRNSQSENLSSAEVEARERFYYRLDEILSLLDSIAVPQPTWK